MIERNEREDERLSHRNDREELLVWSEAEMDWLFRRPHLIRMKDQVAVEIVETFAQRAVRWASAALEYERAQAHGGQHEQQG